MTGFTVEFIASELQLQVNKLIQAKEESLEKANANNPYTTEYMEDEERGEFLEWIRCTKSSIFELNQLKNGIDLLNKKLTEEAK